MTFFDEEMLEANYPRLLDVCKTTFGDIKITANQTKKLKEMTQEQSKSKVWFKHRAGRVTDLNLRL